MITFTLYFCIVASLAFHADAYFCSYGVPQADIWDSQNDLTNGLCRCLPDDNQCILDDVQAHYVYRKLPERPPIEMGILFGLYSWPSNMISNCDDMRVDASGICGFLQSCPIGCIKDVGKNRCLPSIPNTHCSFPYMQAGNIGCQAGWSAITIEGDRKNTTLCGPDWYFRV